ncbi:MAG: sensor domain-containing diguanylate cyclase [Chloroflexota bacterium]
MTERDRRHPVPPADPSDERIRRSRQAFAVTFLVLTAVMIVRSLSPGAFIVDWLLLGLALTAGIAAVVHVRAVERLEARRRDESASFTRILSGLSRSVSADAIVDAIVEEVGRASEADHLVVVRRRPDARVLEARLVSSSPGVPDSRTLLPIADLEEPGHDGAPIAPGAIADRIARRIRSDYGLAHTLAAPLTADTGVFGAIVVSRRMGEPWPEATRRILADAAVEASAALARAYSHQAAQAQASTDALTGLPNRHYFDEYVGLMARRRRAGDAVGILMVDIDKFKVLNDTHGHAVGDEVLRAVAGAIVAAVRDDDVPARFGGEEFVVLLRNPGLQVAVEVGERIRAAVRALDLRRHGVRTVVSVSVGVAVADESDASIEELIESADRALYRAKRGGRDRVVAA